MESKTIAAALGGRKILGKQVTTPDDLARLVRDGLPAASIDALADELGISRYSLLRYLGIPQRTMTRRVGRRSRLTPGESDRTMRLARVLASAVELIGDRERATLWLDTPNRALCGRRPIDELDTDIGAREVEDVLGRIAYGVYS